MITILLPTSSIQSFRSGSGRRGIFYRLVRGLLRRTSS